MRHIKRIVSGFCPETEDHQSIEITFAEVNMLGHSAPGYKALMYSCSYSDECGCSSNGADGSKCPLFEEGQARMI